MKAWSALLLITSILVGCDSLTPVQANFNWYNRTKDGQVPIIDNHELKNVVSASGFDSFKSEVRVPNHHDQTGLGIEDVVVNTGISSRNIRTGEVLRPASCEVGAKVVTQVIEEYGWNDAVAIDCKGYNSYYEAKVAYAIHLLQARLQ